jgi:hypothetical protein
MIRPRNGAESLQQPEWRHRHTIHTRNGPAMPTVIERVTIVPPTPPSRPRLVLAPTRADFAALDGGWWPRSWDPVAELPGLVLALAARFGPIRQLMLSSTAWDSRFRRLAVGTGVVRMGWFTSMDPALLIATTYRGEQIDLLVVPPQTPATAAEQAMATAANPANVVRAPDILAAKAHVRPAPETGHDLEPDAVWDNEGGHLTEAPAPRSFNHHPAAVPA